MEEPVKSEEKAPRTKSAHLMCGIPFWGIAAAAACAYFAYSSFSQLREGDFYWQHGSWTLITWIIWILLIAGVLVEARCWRERTFFGLLLLNFVLGFALAAWTTASASMVRHGRQVSLVLWALSGLASLSTVAVPASAPPKVEG